MTRARVFTADEVADMLGLDRKSVYAAARAGEIPSRRIGRRVLFPRAAILSWLGEDMDESPTKGAGTEPEPALRSVSQVRVVSERNDDDS